MNVRGEGAVGGHTGLARLLDRIDRAPRGARRVFWTYALLLFIGTHLPKLDIRVPGVERPDLIMHVLVFGAWFGLFWITGYAGSIWHRRSAVVSGFVACGYAAMDERLQALPFINRTCAWDDLEANWLGISLAMLTALVLITLTGRPNAAQHG